MLHSVSLSNLPLNRCYCSTQSLEILCSSIFHPLTLNIHTNQGDELCVACCINTDIAWSEGVLEYYIHTAMYAVRGSIQTNNGCDNKLSYADSDVDSSRSSRLTSQPCTVGDRTATLCFLLTDCLQDVRTSSECDQVIASLANENYLPRR